MITWALLAMSAVVLVLIMWYLRHEKTKQSQGSTEILANNEPSVKDAEDVYSKSEMYKFFEITDIKSGIIEMTNSRYRAVMRLASADFFLLSVEEQTALEDSLIAVMMGLSFPVQILTTSEAIETKTIINELRGNMPNLSPELQEYANKFAMHMDGVKSQKTAAMRNAYAVIPFDTYKGFKHAQEELLSRAAILADGLSSAKINSTILETPAIVDLLHHMLNKGKPFKPSEADEAGIMNSFHVLGVDLSYEEVKQSA